MVTSANTVSTQTRKYELRARAESQRETRERIARAAAELHEEKGVAHTTVAEIARRAGVTRLTVYNHFADLSELLPACAAHYEALHPLPDFGDARDPRAALALLYRWYRETEPMFGKLFSDRSSVPELDRFLEQNIDRTLAELADELAAAVSVRGQHGHALIRLALDFWTWRRLSREGLDDDDAAGLMAGTIGTLSRRPPASR
jgi:AcrR family transcriptional regulator